MQCLSRGVAHRISMRTFSTKMADIKRICVVGGGLAGLRTVDKLQQQGFECTLFEKRHDVGGVWLSNYVGYGIQVPWELYEWPDFPYEDHEKRDRFPDGQTVQNYLVRYAKAANVYPACKLNTKIHSLARSDDGWSVEYQTEGDVSKRELFDYVIVCTGNYDKGFIPDHKDRDRFQGQTLHAQDFTDVDMIKGKKVVVVGSGKSGIDCAVVGSDHGSECTILSRIRHWPVPRFIGKWPLPWYTYSRFINFTLPVHYEVSPFSRLMHSLLNPIKVLFWKLMESYMKKAYSLEGDRLPKVPLSLEIGGSVQDFRYRDAYLAGRIKEVKGEIDHYKERSIVLEDGQEIEADVVIYATGFVKNYDMFCEETKEALDLQDDGLYMYRQIIPPRVKNLAFIGSEVTTFNTLLSTSLQVLWLERLLTNKMQLPSDDEIRDEIEKNKHWKRNWLPQNPNRAVIYKLNNAKYHDQLVKDMKEDHLRKTNPLMIAFEPMLAPDYAGLFERKKL